MILYSVEPAHKLQKNGAGLLHTPLRFTTNPNMIRKAYANIGSALSMFCLLSLFEVVISKANEQICLHTKMQVQSYKNNCLVQHFGATLVQQFGYFNTFHYLCIDCIKLEKPINKGFADSL